MSLDIYYFAGGPARHPVGHRAVDAINLLDYLRRSNGQSIVVLTSPHASGERRRAAAESS